jgi:hypothetical protein
VRWAPAVDSEASNPSPIRVGRPLWQDGALRLAPARHPNRVSAADSESVLPTATSQTRLELAATNGAAAACWVVAAGGWWPRSLSDRAERGSSLPVAPCHPGSLSGRMLFRVCLEVGSAAHRRDSEPPGVTWTVTVGACVMTADRYHHDGASAAMMEQKLLRWGTCP